MICGFGKGLKEDLEGCENSADYLLLYGVDKKIWRKYGMSGDCWGFEENCCAIHLRERDFLFDVQYGFPDIVYNLKESREENCLHSVILN